MSCNKTPVWLNEDSQVPQRRPDANKFKREREMLVKLKPCARADTEQKGQQHSLAPPSKKPYTPPLSFREASIWNALISMHACMLRHFSSAQLFATLWNVAHQAPLSMKFSRQEYWSGLPCPPSGNLPNSGVEPLSLRSLVLAGEFFIASTTWEAPLTSISSVNSDTAPTSPSV